MMNITNNTLPFSANKRCAIVMGPRQVAVGSVCMLPHSRLTRILSIKDIIMCLNAGAKVVEFISETETMPLDQSNFANVFSEAHLEFLKKFNTNVKTPVEKRESYLIDIPEAPIPPAPVEEKKEEEVPAEPKDEAVEEPADEVEENVPSEEPEGGADLQEEVAEPEEAPVEETTEEDSEEAEESVEEPTEELEEDAVEDEATETDEAPVEQPKESRKNRRRNRH
jgi:hypothetical protein